MRRRSTPLEDLPPGRDGGDEGYDDAPAPAAPVYTRVPEAAETPRPSRRAHAPEPRGARTDPSELAAGVRTVLVLLLVLSLHSATRYAIRGALATGAVSQQQATVLTLAYPVVVALLLWASATFVR